ncbi:1-aminocyclopropane-1-carboxylate oxidase homolog 1-like [Carex rostrata]
MTTTSDRIRELKTFDETKSGVKGLVDAGITKIPPFFIQPHEQGELVSLPVEIPVIDLSGANSDAALREQLVEKVKNASQTFGFFQVVNHGIPLEVLDEMLEGVKLFNEEEVEVKKKYYTRDYSSKKVIYNSNFDLYQSPAANWRDTLLITMAPEPPIPEELPAVCRDITFKYTEYIKRLGIILFELLSEALGLKPSYLTEIECNKGLNVLTHYYPPCPEPHLTVGTTKHSDPDFLTVLLQDSIGGLQVLYQNHWIDVPPVHGALVINVGDLLQLISNDKLKSVEHRVLANNIGPRVSVACFFTTHLNTNCNRLYGPIKELITEVSPPLYKETTVKDFILYYRSKGLDGRSSLDYFRL